jgi:hypothetical protein
MHYPCAAGLCIELTVLNKLVQRNFRECVGSTHVQRNKLITYFPPFVRSCPHLQIAAMANAHSNMANINLLAPCLLVMLMPCLLRLTLLIR